MTMRTCSEPEGCPVLVESGRCHAHQRERHTTRRQGRLLTYSESWWRRFREYFVRLLIAAGVAPICGSALPGGPTMTASRCNARGEVNGLKLHLHHDPPLEQEEQQDRSAVCNPLRVGFLCETCHRAETRRQQLAGIV